MRSLRLALWTVVLLLGTVAAVHLPTGAAPATPVAAGPPVTGSWDVGFALTSRPAVDVASLFTFGADGTLLVANVGQLPGSLPPGSGLFFTEGHGVWVASGERQIGATFRFLVIDQTAGIVNTGTVRLELKVDPSGNALDGSFALDLLSSEGNPTGTERGTLRATRIQVEPLGTPTAATPGAASLAAGAPAP